MRNFFALSLALVISFFAAMGLSNIPQGLTAVKNVVSERTSHMTSCDNGIEIDGICFETLFPEQNYQVPKYGEETSIQLGVSITNNSSNPYRFELPHFTPELSNCDGTLIKMGGGRNITIPIKESDIPFIEPGKSVNLHILTELNNYIDYGIYLRVYAEYGTVFSFHNFQSGEYNIRLRYTSRNSTHHVHPGLEYREYDDFWVGEVLTPWKTLYLK